MIKVTPAHGVPYYLVDREGDGKFTRDDTRGHQHPPADVGDLQLF